MARADRPPLSRAEAVEHLRSHVLTPSDDAARVGIEQEWHTYALAEPTRHLHPEEVLGAVDAVGPLPGGSAITIEPGGQVEVSTPAMAPWWDALETVRLDGAAMRDALARAGMVAVAAGLDPFRAPVRTLTKSRYAAMETYFDEWRPEGRLMMSSCAALQVNVDLGAAEHRQRRWALAHHLGPVLGAAFACSPSRTHRSARLAVWAGLDPSRTRSAWCTGDPADDWPAFVLGARVMLVRDDDGTCHPVTTALTFAEWLDRGLDGRRPSLDDLVYHCSTLFPPVRPRGWLEVRWPDSLPSGLAETMSAALVAVLHDEEAAERAAHASAPVAHRWADAAAGGPAHRDLAAAAVATLRAAADALDRTGAPGTLAESVADAADRWPARGRCPADDLEERLRRGASPAELADPPLEVAQWR